VLEGRNHNEGLADKIVQRTRVKTRQNGRFASVALKVA
jgi:hypothetical protein